MKNTILIEERARTQGQRILGHPGESHEHLKARLIAQVANGVIIAQDPRTKLELVEGSGCLVLVKRQRGLRTIQAAFPLSERERKVRTLTHAPAPSTPQPSTPQAPAAVAPVRTPSVMSPSPSPTPSQPPARTPVTAAVDALMSQQLEQEIEKQAIETFVARGWYRCVRCERKYGVLGAYHPASDFNRRGDSGVQSLCRTCMREYRAIYDPAHRKGRSSQTGQDRTDPTTTSTTSTTTDVPETEEEQSEMNTANTLAPTAGNLMKTLRAGIQASDDPEPAIPAETPAPARPDVVPMPSVLDWATASETTGYEIFMMTNPNVCVMRVPKTVQNGMLFEYRLLLADGAAPKETITLSTLCYVLRLLYGRDAAEVFGTRYY